MPKPVIDYSKCTVCGTCVDVCPVENTLQLETIGTGRKISKKFVAVGIVSLFMIITGFGIVTGNWQNDLSKEKYLILYEDINSFGHPTSTESVKRFNKEHSKEDNVPDEVEIGEEGKSGSYTDSKNKFKNYAD